VFVKGVVCRFHAASLIYSWDAPELLVPGLRFLGDISYSIYPLRLFVYFVLKRLLPQDLAGHPDSSDAGSLAAFYLSFHMPERPARRFIITR